MAWSVPATAFDSIGDGVGTTALDLATSLEGDVVLLVCFSDGNIVFDTDETFTDSGLIAGQGWIDLYFAGGANNPGRLVAYKVMGSTPDTTVDFENPSARAIGVQSIVIRGADTTTPIHAQSSLASGATGIANAPSLETTVANTLRIIFGIVDDETNVMSAPSGWTLARAEAIPSISANSNASCITAYLESASAGTVDPDAFGGSADDEWIAGHIAFAPAASGGLDRAALIEGASTVAANRLITRTRSAAVSAASTTAAAALLSKSRAAAIAGASTVAAAAVRTVTRSAAIAAESSLTASGSVAGGPINRSALIEAQSSVTATAQRTITRAASVAAQSSVTAAGAVSGNVSRSATIEAASSVTASAVRTVTRSVAIAGASSVTAGGTVGGVTTRSALVEAASSLTAQASVTRRRAASVAASSAVTVERGIARVRSVTVEAASAVSVVSVRTLIRQAAIAANSNVDVSATLAGDIALAEFTAIWREPEFTATWQQPEFTATWRQVT